MYESDWVNVYLDDVELPDGAHIDHHVLDFPRGSVGAVLVDEQERILLPGRDIWGAVRGDPLRSHLLGRLDQRDVDLVTQLGAHLDVDHKRCERERDEHCTGTGESQTRTQAHGSRSAYPTPRTVSAAAPRRTPSFAAGS